VDPDYSIVRECFPYLSRRLLTDDNPRAREALRQLLFAGGDSLSLERVERLLGGLSAFTVDGLMAPTPPAPQQQQGQGRQPSAALQAGGGTQAPTPLLDSTAREVLAAVFSERPTYVQELLVGQAASTADAALRQVAASVLGPALGGLGAARAAAVSNGQVAGGGAPPALALLARLPALVELSAEDRRQLQTAQGITSLLLQQQPVQAQLTPTQAQQLAAELGPLLPQLLPGVAATAQLFVRQLGQRATDRLSAVLRGDAQQGDEYTALD
jgi:aarF domain-containing kinase